MTAGLAVLVAALVVAVAGGGVWQRRNGRMRPLSRAAARDAALTPPQAPASGSAPQAGPADGAVVVTGAQLGQDLGERATLVQFSTSFCAPCRATRRILSDVAGMTSGVTHIEIDAESRLDLVRLLGVLRTPTVLVLAADGRVVRRASGQPRKPDVIAAIGEAAGL